MLDANLLLQCILPLSHVSHVHVSHMQADCNSKAGHVPSSYLLHANHVASINDGGGGLRSTSSTTECLLVVPVILAHFDHALAGRIVGLQA